MKEKIDLEKFICSYIKWNNIQDALKDQGLKCCNDEIVKISQESEDEKIIKALLEYFAEECDTSTISGIYCYKIYDWLKKQSEQKSIGNIKPKFNVGDWVVYNRNDSSMEILYIYDIRDGRYYFNDNIHFSWSVKECDERCHLWTINDAKDGDVLLSKHNQPFIYNGIFDEESVGAYCGIDKLGNDFLIDNFSCEWTYKERVKPATKDQCNTLFAKMKEAGWKWDEEKKELRKIEQPELTEFEDAVKDMMNAYRDAIGANDVTTEEVKKHVKYILSLIPHKSTEWSEEDDAYKLFAISAVEDYYDEKNPLQKDLVDWLKSLKDRVQPQLQPAWSEEDEKMFDEVINNLHNYIFKSDNTYSYIDCDKHITWLKSIKDRVQPQNGWKPSKEQIIALRWVLNNIPYNKYKEEISGLFDQIKDL